MQYLVATTCRMDPSRTREFFAEIQQWEQQAMASTDAPVDHAVYIDRADPTRCWVLTRFDSQETADRFMAGPVYGRFHTSLLKCAAHVEEAETLDLFYAVDQSGAKVMFGEGA